MFNQDNMFSSDDNEITEDELETLAETAYTAYQEEMSKKTFTMGDIWENLSPEKIAAWMVAVEAIRKALKK